MQFDRNARDRYSGHPYFAACVRFCEKYDQASFDPGYRSEPISFFEPMVRRCPEYCKDSRFTRRRGALVFALGPLVRCSV
jgi:predicted HD phosphohydrolase